MNLATAHKLVKIIYTMIKEKAPYDKEKINENQAKWREKRILYFENQLRQLQKTAKLSESELVI